MLVKYNPFLPTKEHHKSDRLSMRNYFDRVFEDAFSVFDDLPFTTFRSSVRSSGIDYLTNEDGSLSVAIEVPGIKEADLAIEVSDGQVSVVGERKTSASSVKINKSFSIPEGYSEDNVVANLQDGILTLTLAAKSLPAQEVKKIAITAPTPIK